MNLHTTSFILSLCVTAAAVRESAGITYEGALQALHFNCSDPEDEGVVLSFQGTIQISIGAGGSFVGTGALTTISKGSLCNLSVQLSGTMSPELNGSYSFNIACANGFFSNGSGTVTGQLVGQSLHLDTLGQALDSFGDTCTIAGTFDGVTDEPVGVCCLPDGSCELLFESDCDLQCGQYQGAGTICLTSCTDTITRTARSISFAHSLFGFLCNCPDICTNPISQMVDSFGNSFELSCNAGLYYALTYVPVGEQPVFVGKCPWFSGRNYAIVQIETASDGTFRFLSSYWKSRDTGCDDYPVNTPNGLKDWIEYRFDTCSRRLNWLHLESPDGGTDGLNVVKQGGFTAPQTINFTAIYPAFQSIFCAPPLSSSRGDGAMAVEEAEVLIAGTAQGGSLSFEIGSASVMINTSPGQPADEVASQLAAAINAEGEMQDQGFIAMSSASLLTIGGVPRSILSYCPLDAGLTATPSVEGLTATIIDSETTLLEWDLPPAVQYDEIYVTANGTDVGFLLPGTTTSITDTIARPFRSLYRVVAYEADVASCAVSVQAQLPCPTDLDGDGAVAVPDLLALLAAWGTNPSGPPDFDGDGIVAVPDLLRLLAAWGPCPSLP